MLEAKTDGRSIYIGDKFSLVFNRTLRIPDDGKTYPLPPGLGTFPIFHVTDYKDKLPEEWVKHGGIFMPMYQREALWIGFNAYSRFSHVPHAVKVAIGKINAISGKPWDQSLKKEEQNYLVCPPQPWLDGINAGNGYIRQFVAMPLGMGYTVEGQITGKEEFGGIQIVVYAPKPGRFKEEDSNIEPIFNTFMTSRPMGIAAGGKMKQKIYPDPYGIDTWDEGNYGRVFVHIINSVAFKAVTGLEPPPTPISAKTYAKYGLPWYDLYDEDKGDLSPSGELKKIKSIRKLDKEKDIKLSAEEEGVEVLDKDIYKIYYEKDMRRIEGEL
jgi:hypothetical protein